MYMGSLCMASASAGLTLASATALVLRSSFTSDQVHECEILHPEISLDAVSKKLRPYNIIRLINIINLDRCNII